MKFMMTLQIYLLSHMWTYLIYLFRVFKTDFYIFLLGKKGSQETMKMCSSNMSEYQKFHVLFLSLHAKLIFAVVIFLKGVHFQWTICIVKIHTFCYLKKIHFNYKESLRVKTQWWTHWFFEDSTVKWTRTMFSSWKMSFYKYFPWIQGDERHR